MVGLETDVPTTEELCCEIFFEVAKKKLARDGFRGLLEWGSGFVSEFSWCCY